MIDASTETTETNEPIENDDEGTPEVPGTGSTLVEGPNAPKGEAKEAPKGGKKTPTQTPTEAKKEAERRAYRVKVLEEEKELNLTDEEATRYIQKGLGAEKKFEEAHKLRTESEAKAKEASRIVEILKSNDTEQIVKLLSDPSLGVNVRQIAEEHLANELEKELLDPRERELIETRAKLKAIEDEKNAKEEEEKTAKEKEEDAKRVTGIKNAIAKKINSVLENSPLPQNERSVGKIAYYMQQAHLNGIPFDPVDIREQVVNDFREDFTKLFAAQEPGQIAEILGEEIIQKIRRWDNSRVSGKSTQKQASQKRTPSIKNHKKKWTTPEQDNLEKFGTLYPYVDME